MPFDRRVESKKDQIKRIELITKNAKVPRSGGGKNKLSHMARENAEMLFNLLHGKGKNKSSTGKKSESMHTSQPSSPL